MATTDKKIDDVAKPGSSDPDASSRPLIIGHKPMVSDPMVSKKSDESNENVSKTEIDKVPITQSAKKIEPVSADLKTQKQEVESTSEVSSKEDVTKAETKKAEKPEENQFGDVEELIASKKYHVKITNAKKNAFGTFLLTMFSIIALGLIVILMLSAFDVIDIGL